jgi:hypothetical protein
MDMSMDAHGTTSMNININSTITSMVMTATSTMSSVMTTATDFTPGYIDSLGDYVPTSDEQAAYQATRDPWASNVRFGYYTLAYICGILGIFIVLNGLWKLRVRYNYLPGGKKLTALFRLASYPELPYRPINEWIWSFGPLGPNLILIGGLFLASCMVWISDLPYYRPPWYGSSLLLLRSEWIAMATLPFI